MKKYYNFSFLFLLLMSAVFSLTSCNAEGDNSGTGYASHFCNVVISETGKYTLYADAGHILLPNEKSQSSLKETFGVNAERLLVSYNYDMKSVELGTDSVTYVKDVTLLTGQLIPVGKILSREAAEAQKVSVADSIFAMNSIQNMHLKNGYLTLSVLAPVTVVNGTGIFPTMTMVLDEEEQPEITSSTATLKLRLCYNRHSAKPADNSNVSQFYASFPVRGLIDRFEKCKLVKVIVRVEGQEAVSFACEGTLADFKLPY